MSINRFNARRDDNDLELVKAAKRMGCIFQKHGPLDYWRLWPGEKSWSPLEIKRPDKVKQPSAYTQIEKDFMALCKSLGINVEVWATVEDIEQSRRQAMVRSAA